MAFTSVLTDNVLNHVFRNRPYAPPKKLYVGLFTANGEVTAGDYKRAEITFGAPDNGIIANDTEVRFSIAITEWGTVTGMGIFDAESGGSQLDELELDIEGKLVDENEQPYIPAGEYKIEVKPCD